MLRIREQLLDRKDYNAETGVVGVGDRMLYRRSPSLQAARYRDCFAFKERPPCSVVVATTSEQERLLKGGEGTGKMLTKEELEALEPQADPAAISALLIPCKLAGSTRTQWLEEVAVVRVIVVKEIDLLESEGAETSDDDAGLSRGWMEISMSERHVKGDGSGAGCVVHYGVKMQDGVEELAEGEDLEPKMIVTDLWRQGSNTVGMGCCMGFVAVLLMLGLL